MVCSMRSVGLLLLLFTIGMLANGCTRSRYRMAADRDTYRVLNEKAACSNQVFPPCYSVSPDPRSRFYDPTNPDCPQLPVQRPILHGYHLPPLASDNQPPVPQPYLAIEAETDLQNQHNHETAAHASEGAPIAGDLAANGENRSTPLSQVPVPIDLPSVDQPNKNVVPAGFMIQAAEPPVQPQNNELSSKVDAALTPSNSNSLPPPSVSSSIAEPALQLIKEASPPVESEGDREENRPQSQTTDAPKTYENSSIRKIPVPEEAWGVLPQNCLNRMLEFETLRDEYRLSFANAKSLDTKDDGVRRLTLANLMELAMINSREYQTRKEILFRTALAVTRQRYQFDLNPTPFGNGTAANYRHLRTSGTEVNRLAIPSGVGVQQTLASGGEFLARFANNIVLTFNGPSGFAADIGSEMIFDFQQSVFQRDVRFESLTQSERDVIYAVRDYIRFRKQLFRDIAGQYYNLLVNYRGVEINAQDYFTNLRGFRQSQAEYRTAEKIPRIQVDQFEQNVLRSRSNVVNNTFALEAALDQLKFRLGLPVEMPIHLDLTELQSISLKDELSVARQMITRTRNELLTAKDSPISDATSLANVAEVLTDRMLNILAIQKRMQDADPENANAGPDEATERKDPLSQATQDLEDYRQRLQILGARMQVDALRAELDAQINADLPVPPLRILIRAIEFASSEMQVINMALDTKKVADQPKRRDKLVGDRDRLEGELAELIKFLERISASITIDTVAENSSDLQQIPDQMKRSVELVKAIDLLAAATTTDLIPSDRKLVEKSVQEAVDKSIELSDKLLSNGPDGWTDIQLDESEALLTGLVQRLDLMNQRGDLADAWRQIKLAGDDLRSILDLRATHVLRTKTGDNDPFNFTFDDSETRLSVALDTPLNRRLQRNNFRIALINYNVGLRNILAAEDNIKLDVREDLRQLSLDRNQFSIAVASAALAFERVISTRLRLQLSVQNVAARDFLESQQAYTNALNSIARLHINYITDRLELFFDLEAFDVDGLGHWTGVSADYGPQVNVDFPSMNPRPYDCLPQRVWYSPTVRHMEHIGPGNAIIGQPEP
jgi:hypothetical protein